MNTSDPGSLFNWLEVGLLDYLFGDSSAAVSSLPASGYGFYLGLLSAHPVDSGTVTELNTISEGGYARQEIKRAIASNGFSSVETIVGGRQIRNACAFTFGPNTKGSAWTTVTHWALFPSAGSGLLAAAWGPFLNPITVANGGYLRIYPGAIRICID